MPQAVFRRESSELSANHNEKTFLLGEAAATGNYRMCFPPLQVKYMRKIGLLLKRVEAKHLPEEAVPLLSEAVGFEVKTFLLLGCEGKHLARLLPEDQFEPLLAVLVLAHGRAQ